MNKIYWEIIVFIALSTLLALSTGCTEEIDLDFDSEETQLVVDATLTNEEKSHYVILSKSGEFLSNEPGGAVLDATVTLTDGGNTITLQELTEFPGTYLIPASFAGVYGKNYTLNISGVDINDDGIEETYQASNSMPRPMDLKSIDLEWSLGQGEKSWHINMDAKEREETVDFYAFAAYLNDVLIDDQISELEYIKDKYFNGNEVFGMWVQSVVEEGGDGKATEHVLEVGDTVTLEVQSVNEDYYNFIEAVDQETGINIPLFSGPPANVPTNVNNNARGFFRVYSVSKVSIELTQEILDTREL